MADGHVWQGDVHGQGACMAGGRHGRGHAWQVGGHVWQGGMHGKGCAWWGGGVWQGACIPSVNARAVRILLEYILVLPLI